MPIKLLLLGGFWEFANFLIFMGVGIFPIQECRNYFESKIPASNDFEDRAQKDGPKRTEPNL